MTERIRLLSVLKYYSNLKASQYFNRLINDTSNYVSTERLDKFKKVLENRNKRFVIVCENLENQGNLSAIARSADAMGLQNIYSIQEEGIATVSSNCGRISLGSETWLSKYRFKTTNSCIEYLKKKGYSIWVSDLSATSFSFDKLIFQPSKSLIQPQLNYYINQTINNFEILNNNNHNDNSNNELKIKKDIIINEMYNRDNNNNNSDIDNYIKNNEKIALVFGNESVGVSDEIKRLSDRRFYLPMTGMVQSFNVSVSVAITLTYLKMQGVLVGDLSQIEKEQLLSKWIISSVPNNKFFLQQLNHDPALVLNVLNKDFS